MLNTPISEMSSPDVASGSNNFETGPRLPSHAQPHEAWQILDSPTQPAPFPSEAARLPPPQKLSSCELRERGSIGSLQEVDADVARSQEILERLDSQKQDLKRHVREWLDQLERLQRQQIHFLQRSPGFVAHHPPQQHHHSHHHGHGSHHHLSPSRYSQAVVTTPEHLSEGPVRKYSSRESTHAGLTTPKGGPSLHSHKTDPMAFIDVDESILPKLPEGVDVPSLWDPIRKQIPGIPNPVNRLRFESEKQESAEQEEQTVTTVADDSPGTAMAKKTSDKDDASAVKRFKKVQDKHNKSLTEGLHSHLNMRGSGHQWKIKKQKTRIMALLSKVVGDDVDEEFADREFLKRRDTWLWRFAHGPSFQAATAAVILINAMVIGLHADLDLKALINNEKRPDWFAFEVLFTLFFSLELSVRFASERVLFFIGPEKFWNALDVVLVFLGILDASTYGLPNLTYLRLLRFIRLLRLARVVKAIHSFRIIVYAIVGSFTSLAWCFIVVGFIIYMFSVFFLNGVTLHFEDKHDSSATSETGTECAGSATLAAELKEHFGSVPKTIMTLWMSISGGLDWENAVQPLREVHWMYEPLYNLYVFFMCLGVLNVVVGWFVATTSDIAAKDRESFVNNEMSRLDQYSRKLRTFFQEADLDRSGLLSWDEFKLHLRDDRVKAYFHALELDVSQASTLFRLLDVDCSNEVSFEEFLSGCMRLKGQARSIDVNMLIYETSRVFKKLERFFDEWYVYTHDLRGEDDACSSEASQIPHLYANHPHDD
mmetsp:Transcript_10479/g.23800  ORF Transcript_10479/g.23800 Transcript_10479/m.23800 type:complete len:768 (+) Transcript_10479:83-2386(+)